MTMMQQSVSSFITDADEKKFPVHGYDAMLE